MYKMLKYEEKLYHDGINYIAGVDEVGRGPLVGPVVAAAVILPRNYFNPEIDDSKKLTEKKRNLLYKEILSNALAIGVGIISNTKIDEVNIYEATKLAMYEAINKLSIKPEHILIDAMPLKLNIPTTSIIKGDSLSISIAAASIIAKVTRDSLMYELDEKYPLYGFGHHKGYPTKEHVNNVKRYGVLKEYRFTFKPICDLINKGGKNEKLQVNKKQNI